MIRRIRRALRPMRPAIEAAKGVAWGLGNRVVLRNSLTVIVYHDVTDEPSEFCTKYDLNVRPGVFERQISFLQSAFNIVSPDDLVQGKLPPRAAMITFDDGFSGFFRNAVPIMEKYGVPCTLFVNYAPVEGDVFWAGLILYLSENQPDFAAHLNNYVPPGDPDWPLFLYSSRERVESYLQNRGEEVGPAVRRFVGDFARPDDLERAARSDLVYYGNHLYKHYIARWMSDEDLLEGFRLNGNRLARYSNYRPLFAFPFGQPGSCFDVRQVSLLLENGARKVFCSSGRTNPDPRADYLDRLVLNQECDSIAKISLQINRSRLLSVT